MTRQAPPHYGFKWLKLAQNKFRSQLISQTFTSKLRQIQVISVSGHFMRFKLMTCQTFAGINMSASISRFLKSNSWRVFAIRPNYVPNSKEEGGEKSKKDFLAAN